MTSTTGTTDPDVKIVETPKKREQRLKKEAQAAQREYEEQLRNPIPTVEAKATATVGDPESLDSVRTPKIRKVGSRMGSRLHKIGKGIVDTDLRDVGKAVKSVGSIVEFKFKGDDDEATPEEGVLTPSEVIDPASTAS
jgi:hypothetical protein